MFQVMPWMPSLARVMPAISFVIGVFLPLLYSIDCLRMISAQTLRVCREGKPLHTFPDHALVNLRRALQRLLQFFQREILAARDLEDRRLAAAAELAGLGQFWGELIGDHDRAVAVGMDQIVGFHGHAGDADLAAKTFRMHPGMRRPDR